MEVWLHGPDWIQDHELGNVRNLLDLLTTLRYGDDTMVITTGLPGSRPLENLVLHNMDTESTREKLILTLALLSMVHEGYSGVRPFCLDFPALRDLLAQAHIPAQEVAEMD